MNSDMTSAPAPVEGTPHRGLAVCVGGVSGVGKTRLLQTHVADAEYGDAQMTGSSVVKSIIAPATVRDFDTWPVAERVRVRDESIRRLLALRAATSGLLLIDGHFTLRNRVSGRVEAIFTAEDKCFYDALVLVDASPECVDEFRRADSRLREAASRAAIAEELDAERREVTRLAAEMGVPLLHIRELDLRGRVESLRRFLDHLRSSRMTDA